MRGTTLVEEASDSGVVVREIAKTLVYYREKLGGGELSEAVVRSTALAPAEAARALEEPLGFRPDILNPLEGFAAVDQESAQTVAGAAACLIGRAA